jgi:putative SOS response-associated peptidase YedK
VGTDSAFLRAASGFRADPCQGRNGRRERVVQRRLPQAALRRPDRQKDGAGKRYAISRRDGQPFGVAGIWENWRNPLTDMWERTFAVITVLANELVAPIHDRMLAILPTEQFPRWLSDEADPRDLLVPFPSDQLTVTLQRSRR